MRDKIKLESTAGTGHFYTTTKNKRTQPEKMEIKKYDPVARKHVPYKETGCPCGSRPSPDLQEPAPRPALAGFLLPAASAAHCPDVMLVGHCCVMARRDLPGSTCKCALPGPGSPGRPWDMAISKRIRPASSWP